MKKLMWMIVSVLIVGLIVIASNYYIESNRKTRIGVLGDYATNDSIESVDSFRAIEFALSEIDKNGERYELVRFDFPQYVDDDALINKLKHEQIDLIIGPSSSGQYSRLASVFKEIDLPFFLVAVSSNQVNNKRDNIFRLTNDTTDQSEAIAHVVEEHLMGKRCVVFYTSHNESFSKSLSMLLVNDLNKGNKANVVDVFEVGDLLHDETIDLLSRSHDVDTAIVIAGPGVSGTIGQLIADANPKLDFVFSAWGKSEASLSHLRNLDNTFYFLSQPEPYNLEAYSMFQEKIVNEKKINLNPFSISAYEITYFVDWVLGESDSRKLEDIASVIHELKDYYGVFNHYQFNEYGDGNKGYGLYRVRNNQFVIEEKFIDLE